MITADGQVQPALPHELAEGQQALRSLRENPGQRGCGAVVRKHILILAAPDQFRHLALQPYSVKYPALVYDLIQNQFRFRVFFSQAQREHMPDAARVADHLQRGVRGCVKEQIQTGAEQRQAALNLRKRRGRIPVAPLAQVDFPGFPDRFLDHGVILFAPVIKMIRVKMQCVVFPQIERFFLLYRADQFRQILDHVHLFRADFPCQRELPVRLLKDRLQPDRPGVAGQGAFFPVHLLQKGIQHLAGIITGGVTVIRVFLNPVLHLDQPGQDAGTQRPFRAGGGIQPGSVAPAPACMAVVPQQLIPFEGNIGQHEIIHHTDQIFRKLFAGIGILNP